MEKNERLSWPGGLLYSEMVYLYADYYKKFSSSQYIELVDKFGKMW